MFLEYQKNLKFLKSQPDNRFLIISERPVLYSAQRMGSVGFEYFELNSEKIKKEYEKHFFRDIFIIQYISYKTGKEIDKHILPEGIKTEILIEYEMSEEFFIRISKIIFDESRNREKT